LIGQTIGDYLAGIVARFPDRVALVVAHQGVRWTYRELLERVDRFAAGLLKLGLLPGDRVGIWSQNCAEWVVTQFATARAGLIMVNINPAYRRSELEYVLEKVQCSALILAPSVKTSDYLGMLQDVLRAQRLPHLRHVIRLGAEHTNGMLNFQEVMDSAGEAERATLAGVGATLQFDDPVNIQFTSGTTGSPKGATLTHHNILNNGFFIGEAMRLTEHDRLCIPVPLYHCFGMVLGNLACMTHGAAMVFPGEGFDAKSVLETVQAERCTGLHGVPTMFIAVLDHPDFASFDLSTLRTGIMAGSPCPEEVMNRVLTRMPKNRRSPRCRRNTSVPPARHPAAAPARHGAGAAAAAPSPATRAVPSAAPAPRLPLAAPTPGWSVPRQTPSRARPRPPRAACSPRSAAAAGAAPPCAPPAGSSAP
jgi:fatty-acyl-CoA synthase